MRGQQQQPPLPAGAALRDTVTLLELVRRESEVLAQLHQGVVELEAIRRAWATLADRTDMEILEAEERLDNESADGDHGRWGR